MRAFPGLGALTVGAALLGAGLVWSWLNVRSERDAIKEACEKTELENTERQYASEAAWLASMAEHAVSRERERLRALQREGDSLASFRFWSPENAWIAEAPNDVPAWLARFPPPREIAVTQAPFLGGSDLAGRDDLDVEPWRTLAFPALALARMSPTGAKVLLYEQFRYVSIGQGPTARALLAAVGDPRGTGDARVTWIELRMVANAGPWDIGRSDLHIDVVRTRR